MCHTYRNSRLSFFQGNLHKVRKKSVIAPGVEHINRLGSLKIKDDTDIFIGVMPEGIDLIKVDDGRQRFSRNRNVLIKDRSSGSRRNMVAVRGRREGLVEVLKVTENIQNRQRRNRGTAERERAFLHISAITGRTLIASGIIVDET